MVAAVVGQDTEVPCQVQLDFQVVLVAAQLLDIQGL
jgi:hypothetical protein